MKPTQRRSAVALEQPEGSDAVHALGRHMLEEAPEELVRGQGHPSPLVGAAVAVSKSDAVLVAGDECLVTDGGAMDVATEVLQDTVRALHDGFREDDPLLAPGHVRQRDAGQSTASKVEESTTEVFGQRLDWNEVALAATRHGQPGATIRCERTARHEHVHVRVPFKCARPGVEDGERSDLAADKSRISAQSLQRLEGSAEEHGHKRALMGAHEASELGGKREDDVIVRHWQEQLALPHKPSLRRVVAAARASSIATGVKEQMLTLALPALGEMPTEGRCAAVLNGAKSPNVTW